MFDFLQKDSKPQDDAVMTHTEKVQESELKERKEEQKQNLAEELHHTRKNSSSVSILQTFKVYNTRCSSYRQNGILC